MLRVSLKSVLVAGTVGALALGVPAVAMAQDLPPAKLQLIAPNGDTLEYTAGDASIYVSTSTGYEGTPSAVDFSLSLSSVTPVDAKLLEWAAQTESKRKPAYDLVLSTTTEVDGEEQEIRYEISGSVVSSFSTSMSTYAAPSLSLSMGGGKLVLNGVAMN